MHRSASHTVPTTQYQRHPTGFAHAPPMYTTINQDEKRRREGAAAHVHRTGVLTHLAEMSARAIHYPLPIWAIFALYVVLCSARCDGEILGKGQKQRRKSARRVTSPKVAAVSRPLAVLLLWTVLLFACPFFLFQIVYFAIFKYFLAVRKS